MMSGAMKVLRASPARFGACPLATLFAAVFMATALGGCANQGVGIGATNSSGASGAQTGEASRTNASGDLVTASDEPETTRRAKVRFELASAYYGRGQFTVALDEVKLALSADPTLAEGHNLRGLIYSALGDARLAEESFRRALQLSPRDPDTMHNFGWFMCQHQRYPEASALFEQALQVPQYRGVTGTLRAQGVCQARAGAYAEAEKSLTRSYELDPGNPATAVNLSEVLLRTGGYERARFYMHRVNSIPQVSNAQTLWLAARIEARLGNRQGADELGYQLRNRYPASPEARAFEQGLFNE
ncbi:hypothetical protein BH09PSE5_BH09PSE5_17470 [soil metagenome]